MWPRKLGEKHEGEFYWKHVRNRSRKKNREAVVVPNSHSTGKTCGITHMMSGTKATSAKDGGQSVKINALTTHRKWKLCQFLMEVGKAHDRRAFGRMAMLWASPTSCSTLQGPVKRVCRINLVPIPIAILHNCNQIKDSDGKGGHSIVVIGCHHI